MKLQLKPFQQKLVFTGEVGRIDPLEKNLMLALKMEQKSIIAFQSPTGTGKTVMLSSLIESLKSKNISFVWIAPSDGDLYLQSLKKIKANTGLGITFEELTGDNIPENQVLFLGWQQINRISEDGFSNKIMRNEIKDLPQVISNTKSDGRKLVVIIDESHIGVGKTTNVQELLNSVFKADVEIHVSATNTSIAGANFVTSVDQEMKSEIIENGVIKRELVKGELDPRGKDSLEQAIFAAEETRIKIKKEFESMGSTVNPLVLIQAKNANKSQLQSIESVLHGINKTYNNKKVALWMDGQKKNTEGIELNDNEIEFLVFKQAIATGWDCPRSHILVQLRESGSPVFEIQVLGRISRNPLLKKIDNDLLNTGFVYSDLENFEIQEDTVFSLKDKVAELKIKNPLGKDVVSTYKEFLGQNSLDKRLIMQMDEGEGDEWVKNELRDINLKTINNEELLKNYLTFKLDYMEAFYFLDNENDGIRNSGKSFNVTMADYQIKEACLKFIRSQMESFKTNESVDVVLSLIEGEYLNNDCLYKLILSNKSYFENFIVNLVNKYQSNVSQSISTDYELRVNNKFQPPQKETFYGLSVKEHKFMKKYLYKPCFLTRGAEEYSQDVKKDKNIKQPTASLGEIKFRQFLEDSSNIEWWYQSGTSKGQHLGIPYKKTSNEQWATFYPDYIYKTTDGRIFIVDIKGAGTADPLDTVRGEDIISKANTLIDFCNSYGFVGGIVIFDDSNKDFKIFSDNTKFSYNYSKNELITSKGWEYLREVVKSK